MAIDETTIAYEDVKDQLFKDAAERRAEWQAEPAREPVTLYSLGFEADDVLTMYAALRSYLKALAGQENEDLMMIQRVVNLMVDIRPSAVKASKQLALKAVGMEGANRAS